MILGKEYCGIFICVFIYLLKDEGVLRKEIILLQRKFYVNVHFAFCPIKSFFNSLLCRKKKKYYLLNVVGNETDLESDITRKKYQYFKDLFLNQDFNHGEKRVHLFRFSECKMKQIC